eukprot:jgi/Chrzof1/5366/Cz16g00070.t1
MMMHNRRRTINLHDSYHALQGHTLVTAGVSSIKHWTVEHLKLEAQAEGVVLTAAATAAIPAAGTRPSLVSAIATAGSGGINGLAVAPSREGAIRSISGSSSSHNEAGLGTTPSGTQAVAAGMTNAGPPAAEADATTTGATPFASAGVGVPEQPLQPPLQPPEEATTDTVNHAPQLLQPAVAEPAGQQAPQPVPASYFAAPAAAPSSRPYVSPAGASWCCWSSAGQPRAGGDKPACYCCCYCQPIHRPGYGMSTWELPVPHNCFALWTAAALLLLLVVVV